MLKVKPVKKYITPNYPDKRQVLKNPSILNTVPQAWKGKVCAGLVLSYAVLMALSGCQRARTAGVPLAPAYLTEEEAYSIVHEEALKYGVMFEKDGLEMTDVEFLSESNINQDAASTAYKFNILLDGYDEEKRIGFEFVSESDVAEYNANLEKLISGGIQYLSAKDYSDNLEESIRSKNGNLYFDSFYTNEYTNIEDSRAALREQIVNFMEWLKSQGINK